MKIYTDIFDRMISPANLFRAWHVFKRDKWKKPDVAGFGMHVEKHIFDLHREFKNGTYRHSSYSGFFINDPKQRHIHRATVRDRILHHAIFAALNPIFEPTFIASSFSCRVGYGTHRGVEALARMARKVSRNNTKPCFVLKCDVQKFFDSVDHAILVSILGKRIKDENAMRLLRTIIESYRAEFPREREREFDGAAKGIPIGNLTSQLFANIYMNEFDQFVKHVLKVKHYARYTDDFAIVSESCEFLEGLLPRMAQFLKTKLALRLHPKKIILRPFHQGTDFLGYVLFPRHRLVRTKTIRRIFRKMRWRIGEFRAGRLSEEKLERSLQSCLGVFSHADAYHLGEELKNLFWLC